MLGVPAGGTTSALLRALRRWAWPQGPLSTLPMACTCASPAARRPHSSPDQQGNSQRASCQLSVPSWPSALLCTEAAPYSGRNGQGTDCWRPVSLGMLQHVLYSSCFSDRFAHAACCRMEQPVQLPACLNPEGPAWQCNWCRHNPAADHLSVAKA